MDTCFTVLRWIYVFGEHHLHGQMKMDGVISGIGPIVGNPCKTSTGGISPQFILYSLNFVMNSLRRRYKSSASFAIWTTQFTKQFNSIKFIIHQFFNVVYLRVVWAVQNVFHKNIIFMLTPTHGTWPPFLHSPGRTDPGYQASLWYRESFSQVLPSGPASLPWTLHHSLATRDDRLWALSAREAHLFTREKDCATWIFGVVLFCFVSPLLSNVLQVNSQWGDGDD